MSQHLGFNDDFTDADEQTLLKMAPLANQPRHRYHTCGWVTSRGVCSELVRCNEFPDHLRTRHNIVGPEKAPLKCYWINCYSDMKKESLTRHVQEIHLRLEYPCPICPERFTRSYTLHGHVTRKHSDSDSQ